MTPHTNEQGLPEPFLLAAQDDEYDAGPDTWRSATELVGPARAAALRHAHPDKVEVEDVSDRIHLLMGKAVHSVLEHAGTTGLAGLVRRLERQVAALADSESPAIADLARHACMLLDTLARHLPSHDEGIRERRLFATILGQRISGQFDHLDLRGGVLSDYKNTSVFTVTYALKNRGTGVRTRWNEWVAQLNVLAYLAELAGYDIRGLEVVVVLDGWSRSEAERQLARDPDTLYPQAKVIRLDIPQWSLEERQLYLVARVQKHLDAENQLRAGLHAPLSLVHCTDGERWADPPTKRNPQKLAKRCIPGRRGYCPVRSYCASLKDGQHLPGELGEP